MTHKFQGIIRNGEEICEICGCKDLDHFWRCEKHGVGNGEHSCA